MFDLNAMKPDNPRDNVRVLKNFRYLLFTFKSEEEKTARGEAFIHENKNFTAEEALSIKEQIEEMEFFDGWSNFGDTFDVVWVGLYVETDNRNNPLDVYWRPGLHGADRQLIFPVRLTRINSIKRMELTYKDTREVMKLEFPEALKNEVLKNKAKQQEIMERQMIAQMLPGGDVFAKKTIKENKIKKAMEEQKALNDRLKEIAKEEREANDENDQ